MALAGEKHTDITDNIATNNKTLIDFFILFSFCHDIAIVSEALIEVYHK
jgi:hypothetical protein